MCGIFTRPKFTSVKFNDRMNNGTKKIYPFSNTGDTDGDIYLKTNNNKKINILIKSTISTRR
jgi:hypothetical protein